MATDPNFDIAGIIPAAGVASRLGLTGYSKEIIPVNYQKDRNGKLAANLVIHGLFSKMKRAGITNIHIIIRKDKLDISKILGDGSESGVNISYCIMDHSPGVPFSIARAIPFCNSKLVAVGFPDIVMEPETIFLDLRNHINDSQYDFVLAVFPVDDSSRVDMVKMEQSFVNRIEVKPKSTSLTYAWAAAIWKPGFSAFLSKFTFARRTHFVLNHEKHTEIHLGDVFNMALESGLKAGFIKYQHPFIDTGTPESFLNYSMSLRRENRTD